MASSQINMFRSEYMEYVQFMFPREAAYQSTYELGRLGAVHFRDLNTSLNPNKREFAGEVKRCDELLRVVRFFRNQLNKNGILPNEDIVGKQFNFADLEARFDDIEKDIRQTNQNEDEYVKYKAELIEMKHTLELGAVFFQSQDTGKLGFVAGVVSQRKLDVFHRMIFVATRGNVFFNSIPINELMYDAQAGGSVEKHVFVIFFSGTQIQQKLQRICESYGASLYQVSASSDERLNALTQIDERLETLRKVEEKMQVHKSLVLSDLQENINEWSAYINKEKAVFHTLNLFQSDVISKCLVGEGWVAVRSMDDVHSALQLASSHAQASLPSIAQKIETHKKPPTYIRTTKVTEAFQTIVNSFGTANYREVNPGLFTIFSFPFLFALMFGDFGHGILLTLVALFFVLNEKKLSKGLNDIVEYLYFGRYMLLLMGFQATFCGLMYNECFSLSMNLVGSGYTCDPETRLCDKHSTYWLGVDPVWRQTYNNLVFTNSVKMKLSIIVGVSQMVVGIFFSFLNQRYFKRKINIYCEFIPQILLMLSLFGYLSFLIVYKWVVDTPNKPMLIRTMIDMFLGMGKAIDPGEILYPGQDFVQRSLLIVVLITIPWMLLPKPIILIVQHYREEAHKKQEGYYALGEGSTGGSLSSDTTEPAAAAAPAGDASSSTSTSNSSSTSSSSPTSSAAATKPQAPKVVARTFDDPDEEEFNLGEIAVHQLIETIEFALGCVSNTASYLRLWALSLAHGQLAEVFFNYAMLKIPAMIPVLGSLIGVPVWLGATFIILMAMEGLSAFLHCLRLHWVEFQNKFYKAEGYEFAPLDFVAVLAEDERIAYELRMNR